MLIIAICTVILVALGIIEQLNINNNIDKIKIRILVNGTRGKSTVTRLVNAALNNCGIKSMAKSTGSRASIIKPDLSEEQIDRRFGKNMVREQRCFFRKAAKENCEAAVCECSAVRPESQIIFSSKLTKPTHVVITNFYDDHIDQMGHDTKEILMLSVPKGQEPITSGKLFHGSTDDFEFKAHPNSIAIALEVCDKLGLDREKALAGMKKAKGDIGMTKAITAFSKNVVNGFAANDTSSAKQLFENIGSGKITVVYANRADREFRIKSFARLFRSQNISSVAVIGDNRKKCARIFNGKAYSDKEFNQIIKDAEDTIICCGNIVGSGKSFIDFCMENTR